MRLLFRASTVNHGEYIVVEFIAALFQSEGGGINIRVRNISVWGYDGNAPSVVQPLQRRVVAAPALSLARMLDNVTEDMQASVSGAHSFFQLFWFDSFVS
jgi:hypothetical protein